MMKNVSTLFDRVRTSNRELRISERDDLITTIFRQYPFHSLYHDDPERLLRLKYYASPDKFLEWCLYYLAKAFPFPFEAHHEVEAQCLFLKGQIVVVLLPRGYGKTTIIDAWTIWSVCYGYDPLLVRIEYDIPTAKLKSLLVEKYCLTGKIAQDYQLEKGDVWRPGAGELHIKNRNNPFAQAQDIYLRCAGARSIYQGSLFDFSRISTVIINDIIKNSLEATSAAWNNFIWSMIKNDIAYAGGSFLDHPVTVLFVTTIQAEHDISDRLSQDASSVTFKAKAIDGTDTEVREFAEFVSNDISNIVAYRDEIQGIPPNLTGVTFAAEHLKSYCQDRDTYQEWFHRLKSTWSAKFPMFVFVWELYQTGVQIFLRLRQHITQDDSVQKFRREWWVPYNDLDRRAVLDGNYQFLLICDPSAKTEDNKAVNDPQAIIIKAYDPVTRDQFYLDSWMGFLTPISLIYKIFDMMNTPCVLPSLHDMCVKELPGFQILFEANQAQAFGIFLLEVARLYQAQLKDVSTYPDDSEILGHQTGDPRPAEFCDPHYWNPVEVIPYHTSTNKLERIGGQRRQGYMEGRHMHYIPGHPGQEFLIKTHLRYRGVETHGNKFSLEEKVDGMDADSIGDEWWDCYVEIDDTLDGLMGAEPMIDLG